MFPPQTLMHKLARYTLLAKKPGALALNSLLSCLSKLGQTNHIVRVTSSQVDICLSDI